MSNKPKLTPLVVAAQDKVPCMEHGYLADIEAAEDAVEFKDSEMDANEGDLTVVPLCETPDAAVRTVTATTTAPAKSSVQLELLHKQSRELSSVSEETLLSDGSLLECGHRSDRVPFPHCQGGCNPAKSSDYTQLRRRLNLVTCLTFLTSAGVIIGLSCYYTPGTFRWAVVLLAAQLPLLYILQYSLGILLLPLIKPDILQQNSQFYSASAPDYICDVRPSVTLLLSINDDPLTKDGTEQLRSAQTSAAQYRSSGGEVNVMLVDADLLALDEPQKAARMSLYDSLQLPYLGLPSRMAQSALRNDTGKDQRSEAEIASLQLRRSRNYVLNLVRRMETRIDQAKSLGATLSSADAMYQVWSSKYYDREFLAQGEVGIGDLLITLDMNSDLSAESITSLVNEFTHSDDISYVRSISSTTSASSSPTAVGHSDGCGARIALKVMKTAEMVKVIMGAIGGVILPADDDFAVKWTTLREVGDAFELAESVDHVEFWDEASVTGSLDLACTLSKRGMLGRYVAYNDLSPRFAASSLSIAAKVFVRELPAKAITLVRHCWQAGRWDQWHHIIVLAMSPWAVLLAILSAFVSLFLAFDMPALWTICAACAVLLAVAVGMVVAAIFLSQLVSYHFHQQERQAKERVTDIEQN